jgi:hypothetical protein
MPIVLDPANLPPGTLRELLDGLKADLKEVLDHAVRQPRGKVIDPASLATAEELVRSAIALLDRPGTRDRATLAAEANLAYAVLLATIDLVKSHTDVPRVPRGPPPAT